MFLKYKTLHKIANCEIIEKKSRFIATCTPIRSEEEAKHFINDIKKKYYDASHNVFAYRVLDRQQLERQSDDNEPSGTAGMPILDLLRKENVQNSAIVVTRYYGGILLGKGGLVRAYGTSAKKGLIASGIIEKILYQRISINIDYGQSGKIQYEISHNKHVIQDVKYADDVQYFVLINIADIEKFVNVITNLCNGLCKIVLYDKLYGYWLNNELITEVPYN